MDDELFDLILFRVSDQAADRKQVIENIARLLKLSHEAMAKVEAAGDRVGMVVRSGLPREIAEKYRQALLKSGAVCNMRPASEHLQHLDLLSSDQYLSVPEDFHCPSCNYLQPIADGEAWPKICPRCGVVPEKFQLVSKKKEAQSSHWRHVAEERHIEAERRQVQQKRKQAEARHRHIEEELRHELGFTRLMMLRAGRYLGAVATWAAILLMAGLVYLAYLKLMAPESARPAAPPSQVGAPGRAGR